MAMMVVRPACVSCDLPAVRSQGGAARCFQKRSLIALRDRNHRGPELFRPNPGPLNELPLCDIGWQL